MTNAPEPAVSVVSVMTNNTNILDDLEMQAYEPPIMAPSMAQSTTSHQTNATTYSQISNMKYSPANTEIDVIPAFDGLKLALTNNDHNQTHLVNNSSGNFELSTINEVKVEEDNVEDSERAHESVTETETESESESVHNNNINIKESLTFTDEDISNAMKTLYRVGTICMIHSLQKQTEYNHKFCRIIGYQKSQKNGKIDIYYVKILDRFKKTQFHKANILKVENLSDLELDGGKEKKCVLCSCFVCLALLALIFIAAAVYYYFFYTNDAWYYTYVVYVFGCVGIIFMLCSLYDYFKSIFCCCCCNCCYIRRHTGLCCV